MEKSYETIKIAKGEIEVQLLQRTVIFTLNGEEADLSVSEAEELHSKLGSMLGICHPQNYYYLEEMTHME